MFVLVVNNIILLYHNIFIISLYHNIFIISLYHNIFIISLYYYNIKLKIQMTENKNTKTKLSKKDIRRTNTNTNTKTKLSRKVRGKNNNKEITKEIQWNELLEHHRNPPINFLPRSKDIRTKYFIHKKKINKKYDNINNYIKQKYFSNKNKLLKFRLDKNIFPYLIDKNIEHYILWFNPIFFNKEFPDFNSKPQLIRKFIKILFPKSKIGNDIIYYENNVENRSVDAVRHIQIFKKKN
jgi:hypothetical protein